MTHAISSPSAAPLPPSAISSGCTAAAAAMPPMPQAANSARTTSGPWRSSRRQPKTAIGTTAASWYQPLT